MKTLILEVDEGVYSKIKSFIELLPSELCHQVDDADLTQAETPVIHKQSSSLLIFHRAALARPKGARPVVQTTGFQPPSLSVGGSVRRSSTHQLSAGGC